MDTKSIITSALLIAGAIVMTSCSNDTIWEEISYGKDAPSYSKGELPAMLTVYKDRAEVTLFKDLTHYIYLDGVLITEVKPRENDKKVVLRALTPSTEYHLFITALDGEKVLIRDVTFTTHPSFATVIGQREMNIYDYNEEELVFVMQIPGGDFLDLAESYYNSTDIYLRRTDADGKVKWRSAIRVSHASISEEGNIAAWSYSEVYRVYPETGAVQYKYTPKLYNGLIKGACVCKDGGMAVVGMGNTVGKYYFARLDANGQLVHEEEGDIANELFYIHETTDGNVVAMGRKGNQTFVAITFDASGNVVNTSSDYEENRDLGYRSYIYQSIRDSQGNVYFQGGEEVDSPLGSCPAAIVAKVDAQGKIQWIHTLFKEYEENNSISMNFVSDDRLCLLYRRSRNTTCNCVAFLTTENELLQDISFNAEYSAIYAWPVNEDYTEFCLFDRFGRIIYIDTEGE